MALGSVAVAKRSPLGTSARVLAKLNVTLELEHSDWGVGVGSLGVECHIPDTGRAILWVTITACVHKVLLGGCVCSDERNQIVCIDGLGSEKTQHGINRVRLLGQETCRSSFGVVLATNES